ncbi:MAG: peptide-methionine (S)-S-oxide reductase MsrA [Flavobacteriales bacterium]
MNTEFATFGGGCFWGVEKFLQEIPGVIDAVSGYAGGNSANPTYSSVCGGDTNHAEVVNVEYNPNEISYEELVTEFIKTYRDSSEGNRNSTSQYRSIVLYRNEDEKRIVNALFENLVSGGGKKITTQVKPLTKFYEAEPYHQDYYGSCRVSEENLTH